MSKYEEYKNQHTIAHAVLAAVGLVLCVIALYNMYDVYIAVVGGLPFRTAHTEIVLIGVLPSIPLIAFLEWQCRRQQFPSKRQLWLFIGIVAASVLASKSITPHYVRTYFKNHGYELCLKYYSGNKQAKNWEVWAPQGQCPANPRSV